jgi:hypothetical protein
LGTPVPVAPPYDPSTPSLSLLQRTVAIFTRPTQAWHGLRERSQWWFPLLLVALVGVVSMSAVYQRAFLPMITGQMESQVESGQMPAESYDQAVAFMSGPIGLAIFVVQQLFFTVLLLFVVALFIWFGMSFVLGQKMKYRWAVAVAAWSSLVTIPATLLTTLLAWYKEDWQSAHVGFGILLPETDRPTKLMTALGIFLDGIGPLALWYVAVLVIGTATLSGAPRRSTAYVIGALYLVLVILGAALASLQAPAA